MGALLNGFKKEAWGLAVVFFDKAAVGQHWGEVIGEDTSVKRHQIVTVPGGLYEFGLIIFLS